MKFLFTIFILFSTLAHAEEFSFFCEGKREFRSFKDNKLNFVTSESVLLKIKKDSMEYIGINSGRKYIFRNTEYTATKRPPHEDIKIKENYELTLKNINASQIITDIGNSMDSQISLMNVNINHLSGKLTEIENVSNKKTGEKKSVHNFQAICKKEG